MFISLYIAFLVIVVGNNKCLFSKNIFGEEGKFLSKKQINSIVIIVIVQIALDLILIPLTAGYGTKSGLVESMSIVFFWVVAYFVISKEHKSSSFMARKVLISLLMLIVTVSIGYMIENYIANELAHLNSKYISSSANMLQQSNNWLFLHSVTAFVIDTVLGFIFVFNFDVLKGEKQRENNPFRKKSRMIGKAIIRCFSIMILLSLISAFRVLMCSNYTLCNIEIDGSNSRSYIFDDSFDHCSTSISINRINNENAYSSNKIVVHNNNSYTNTHIEAGTIKLDALENNYIIENGIAVIDGNSTEYNFDGVKVFVYLNSAIGYTVKDKPTLIKFSDISKIKEDEMVTNVLKTMLKEGNIKAFEYGEEYLVKYDKEFLKPYVERYRNGEFNEAESAFLDVYEYRYDYIMNLAKQSLI